MMEKYKAPSVGCFADCLWMRVCPSQWQWPPCCHSWWRGGDTDQLRVTSSLIESSVTSILLIHNREDVNSNVMLIQTLQKFIFFTCFWVWGGWEHTHVVNLTSDEVTRAQGHGAQSPGFILTPLVSWSVWQWLKFSVLFAGLLYPAILMQFFSTIVINWHSRSI